MKEQLCFKYEGSWITSRIREMFWIERRSYSEVEETCIHLLSCYELSEAELKDTIRQIIEGRKCLSGTAGGGESFILEDDNHKIQPLDVNYLLEEITKLKQEVHKLTKNNKKLRKQNSKLHKELKESNETIMKWSESIRKATSKLEKTNSPLYKLRVALGSSNMVDSHTFHDKIYRNPSEEDKKEFSEFCEKYSIYPGETEHGNWRWVNFYDKTTDELLSSEDLRNRGIAIVEKKQESKEKFFSSENPIGEAIKAIPEELGWLSPTGEFIEGDWGEHEKVAHEIICKNGWELEFEDSVYDLCRDFLVYEKGWVLLDKPDVIGYVKDVCVRERLTKKQKEFLFDYFTSIGDNFKANSYFQEDN